MREEDTPRALSLSYSFLRPVNIATYYRATYLPHGQMLPYNGSFFFLHLIPDL